MLDRARDRTRARIARPLGAANGAGGDVIQVRIDQSLEEIVQKGLEAALNAKRGNRSRAARRLGISLRTVQRHLAHGNGRASAAR